MRGVDWKKLRLFFLSLLWRAAASSRHELDEIAISQDQLDKLKEMLLARDADPVNFYPIQLTQLSTRGEIHNHSPIADTKTIGPFEDVPEYQVPFFRFYFDGLIAHFDRRAMAEIERNSIDDLFLGHGERLIVSTVTYENSFQRKNFERIKAEATCWHPPKDFNPKRFFG